MRTIVLLSSSRSAPCKGKLKYCNNLNASELVAFHATRSSRNRVVTDNASFTGKAGEGSLGVVSVVNEMLLSGIARRFHVPPAVDRGHDDQTKREKDPCFWLWGSDSQDPGCLVKHESLPV